MFVLIYRGNYATADKFFRVKVLMFFSGYWAHYFFEAEPVILTQPQCSLFDRTVTPLLNLIVYVGLDRILFLCQRFS